MQPFKFKFQKILEYREHLEKMEKQKFAEVLKGYVDKENELKGKQNKRKKYLYSTKKDMDKGDFLSMKWRDKARHALSRGIEINESELGAESQKVEDARAELLEYTKKKKIMEKLKERDYEEWKREAKREEKKLMDEIAQHMEYEKSKNENSGEGIDVT